MIAASRRSTGWFATTSPRAAPVSLLLLVFLPHRRELLIHEPSGTETRGQPAPIFVLTIEKGLLDARGGDIRYKVSQLGDCPPCLFGFACQTVRRGCHDVQDRMTGALLNGQLSGSSGLGIP